MLIDVEDLELLEKHLIEMLRRVGAAKTHTPQPDLQEAARDAYRM
jgi:hypothetical protein